MNTPEDKRENMERVLEEALLLCEERGIAALNKTNLANKTKISTKSIKRYFTDKTEIIFKVSQKLLERWYKEIELLFVSAQPEQLKGIEKLFLFLEIHNTYLLQDYRGLVFIQDADLYCRFHEDAPKLYWKQFRKISNLEAKIKKLVEAGLEDNSIKQEMTEDYSAHMITTLCAGLVEHLACDIHCQAMTLEEAVEMSNKWIRQLSSCLRK